MITHLQKWSLLALLAAGSLSAQEWKPSDWPVLKHYDKEHLFQIALPLGGIGTKTKKHNHYSIFDLMML